MIVSASRRTDIPAWYGDWFWNRIEAGFCDVPNPFNARQISRVQLTPEAVHAFVFWTRQAQPFLPIVDRLCARGFVCSFLYTITGYGRPLEPRSPPVEEATETFLTLAHRLPMGAMVWRFDPIILGARFPPKDHIRRFTEIARRLQGSTERVVISPLQAYRKTQRRIGKLYTWDADIWSEVQHHEGFASLCSSLADVAHAHNMSIEMCAQANDYTGIGIGKGRCIDPVRLAALDASQRDWPHRKDPGQRPHCGCALSRDIGVSDTCPFGCRYCYATQSEARAEQRFAEHDPLSTVLFSRQPHAQETISQGRHGPLASARPEKRPTHDKNR